MRAGAFYVIALVVAGRAILRFRIFSCQTVSHANLQFYRLV